MSLNNFITNILNVNEKDIDSINSVSSDDETINVFIKLKPKTNICPYCGSKMIGHGCKKRTLTHSTFINRKCTIIFKQRRYFCKKCEITISENCPFASKSKCLTYETINNILIDLKNPNITYSDCAKRHNVSVTQVQRTFDTHVNISRKELTKIISVDEHYFPNSDQNAKYIFLIMDFDTGIMLDVLRDRKKDTLISYFSDIKNRTLNKNNHTSELDNVQFISMDMNDTYRSVFNTYFPNAIICADSFHVIKQLNQAFKAIRLKYHRLTQNSKMKYLFVKFRYVFDHGTNLDNDPKYNKVFKQYMNHRDILTTLLDNFPELKKAYLLKEKYIHFNETANVDTAETELLKLIDEFSNCQIEEYVAFRNLLMNWCNEIINSFNLSKSKRINNSYIESKNSRIELLLIASNGLSNFKRTRNRILYCLNKDDKYKI